MLEAVTDRDRVVGLRGEGTRLEIPAGVKEIAHGALRERTELESVILPEGCRMIGQHAFFRCRNLRSVHLPQSLEEIGTKAFSHCSSLQEITVPEGCRLGEKPFENCSGLEKIVLGMPQGGLQKDLFFGCPKVRDLQTAGISTESSGADAEAAVDPALSAYLGIPDADGFLVREGHLIAYFGEDAVLRIPDSASEIDPRVFKNNSRIEHVEFPAGLRRIGWNAFDSCSSLKEIRIPAGVRIIESEAFRQCFSLETVRIQKNCTLGRDVFYACRNIREFDVDDSGTIPADYYGIPAEDGFLIRDGELINYWGPTARIRVPEGVRKIARGAFNHAFMSFRPLEDSARIELPSTLEEMDFMRILRGSQISLSFPERFLLQQRPLDPDLGEWLATKWAPHLRLREITALYLFQDHSRWPFQLEDEIRTHIPQAASHILELLADREMEDKTKENLQAFLRRWEKALGPALRSALGKKLQEADADQEDTVPPFSVQLPDVSGDRLRIPPRSPGRQPIPGGQHSALSEFALLYLSGKSVPADPFYTGMQNGPQTVGAVWQQEEAYFVRLHGSFVRSDGRPYALESAPVKAAHSLEMPEEILRNWRRFFASRALSSLLGQLEEPVYAAEDFETDLFMHRSVPIRALQELPWWDGLHLYDYHGNNIVLEIDPGAGLTLGWKLGQLPYGVIASQDDPLIFGKLRPAAALQNRRANRIRYTLDRLTYTDRLAEDDASLRPFLQALPPEKAVSLMRRTGASPELNAVLLESQKQYQHGKPAGRLTLD